MVMTYKRVHVLSIKTGVISFIISNINRTFCFLLLSLRLDQTSLFDPPELISGSPVVRPCNNSRVIILGARVCNTRSFFVEPITDVILYNAAIIKIRLDNRLISTSQIGRRDKGLNPDLTSGIHQF